jgi:hypothetical protein
MDSDEPGSGSQLSRRRLLQWGSAATAVTVAGCLGGDSDGDDDPANQTDDNSSDNNGNNNDDDSDDNDDDNDGNSDDSEYTSFDTELEMIAQLQGVTVGTGSVDTEEIHQWAVDEDREGIALEESGDTLGHTLYEVTKEDVNLTLGVSEQNLVIGANRSLTESSLRTIGGERERAHETYAGFAWLLSVVGEGEFVVGGFLPENKHESSKTGPRVSANGYAVSLETENGQTHARFAATYPDLTEEIRETVRSEAGSDADEREIAFEGDRAFVRATYGDDLIAALDGAESDAQVTIGDGEEPTTTEGTVPEADTDGLPALSEYVWLMEGRQSVFGATGDIAPFRTVGEGSLESLDSTDPLLVVPVQRNVEVHNSVGPSLLFNVPYLFQIIFDVTPSETNGA